MLNIVIVGFGVQVVKLSCLRIGILWLTEFLIDVITFSKFHWKVLLPDKRMRGVGIFDSVAQCYYCDVLSLNAAL